MFGADWTKWYETVEQVMPLIIEEGEEEEMTANMRVEFLERQQKQLNEAIEVGPSSKKQRTGEKGSSSKLAATPLLMSIPPSLPAPKVEDMESIHFRGLVETVTISSDDFTLSAYTPLATPINVPNREKLDVILERFPTFTSMEPSTSHLNEFFSILERVPVDMTIDPQQNFMAHVPHGTIDKTIEAIMHLKNYLAMQTAKVE